MIPGHGISERTGVAATGELRDFFPAVGVEIVVYQGRGEQIRRMSANVLLGAQTDQEVGQLFPQHQFIKPGFDIA